MSFLLKIFLNKRRLLCCLLFFIVACHSQSKGPITDVSLTDSLQLEKAADKAFYLIEQAKKNVEQGDLILRTGRDFTSDAMRRLSVTDKTYSHCGIACFENDTLFVYHAIGGEWNPDQQLRRDPFELFCNPYENKGIGLFRYHLDKKEQANLLNIVRKLYSLGTKFDMQFDLNSDDRMYCSEFVFKSIIIATANRIKIQSTKLDSIKFIAVDNLFINPFCTPIRKVVFKHGDNFYK